MSGDSLNRIEPRPGIEVFTNKGGEISIKQIDVDSDDVVVVHPDDVERLIEMLRLERDQIVRSTTK
jgi:hypothetical protein